MTVVLDFMNQTITFMDSLDWIERYSWFGYFVSRSIFPLHHVEAQAETFSARAQMFTTVRFSD